MVDNLDDETVETVGGRQRSRYKVVHNLDEETVGGRQPSRYKVVDLSRHKEVRNLIEGGYAT